MRIAGIHVAKLIHQQITLLAVDVVRKRFKTTEQEGAAHHSKVAAQGIEKAHAGVKRILSQVSIITLGSKGVIEDFIKSYSRELFTYYITERIVNIGAAL